MKEARQRGWANMEALLDDEMGKEKKPVYIQLLPYAASFVLLVTAGFYLFQSDTHSEITYTDNITVEPYEGETNLSWLQNNQTTTDSSAEKKTEEVSFSDFEKTAGRQTVTVSKLSSDSFSEISEKHTASISENLLIKEENVIFSDNGRPSSKLVLSPDSQTETAIEQQQAENRLRASSGKFVSNTKQNSFQTLTPGQIRNTFFNTEPPINLGLTSHGSVGLVSKDMENYGLRLGFELRKPLGEELSLNSGVRYSSYKDTYNSTYNIGSTDQSSYLVQKLSNRNVSRRFVEIPLYADYKLHNNVHFKGGVSVTYNTNRSADTNTTSAGLVTNDFISDSEKREAGKLLGDQHGYLGEAVLGATFNIQRISFDVEGTYGVISNQKIDNRNILGARISYRIGNR